LLDGVGDAQIGAAIDGVPTLHQQWMISPGGTHRLAWPSFRSALCHFRDQQ
jgi:hypothetical protein